MHDIFISYSREDVGVAKNLAKNLEKEGFSVWWDRKIPTGKSFDEVIEKAIDDSKCVIILWSDDSVKSQWARTEAAEGRRRGILVPVLIEDVEIPLAFRNLQAANLMDWDNDHTNIHFVNLIKDIRSVILEGERESGSGMDAEEPVSSLPEESTKVSTQKKTRLKTPIIVLGVISVLALAAWGISKYFPNSVDELNGGEAAVNLPDTPEELDFWFEMERINSDSSYRAYQEKYHSGFYDSVAQIRRDSIKRIRGAIYPDQIATKSYRITTKTMEGTKAGTGDKVVIKLIGTGLVEKHLEPKDKGRFLPNQINTFDFVAEDIGELIKFSLTLSRPSDGGLLDGTLNDLKLDWIIIENLTDDNKTDTINVRRWIGDYEKGGAENPLIKTVSW